MKSIAIIACYGLAFATATHAVITTDRSVIMLVVSIIAFSIATKLMPERSENK